MTKCTATSRDQEAQIGIIGGSGLYHMKGFTKMTEVQGRTPFGTPSAPITIGNFKGIRVAFLARHGQDHRIRPTGINYRANIHAMKALGVNRIFSVSAVGSMKEAIRPGDCVLPDQLIDRTTQRPNTFFDRDVVAHVSLANPMCRTLSSVIEEATRTIPVTVHRPGTYLCIEGPQFSTKAESFLYRQWGVDIIGMTNVPEAKLAREAEICYATLALVTDYDCWHETEEAVSVGGILEIMKRNVEVAQEILANALEPAGRLGPCACHNALDHAVITSLKAVSSTALNRYELLLHRQLSANLQTKRKR